MTLNFSQSLSLLFDKINENIIKVSDSFSVDSKLKHSKMSDGASCQSGATSNLKDSQIVNYDVIKDLPNHPEKLLIDVREPDELIETGKIPTSINIPSKTLEEKLKLNNEEFFKSFGRPKPTNGTEMIFHCKGGGRAGHAAELAISMGYVNSKSYKGSWLDWSKNEGLN
ncbi:CLUMA_CG017295, isoform A [Clunio marinus]|uniref:CLUMA_CG017295, isoform A n=1 Tax=Clunio marinus TaxID=568069 RepID=A0A1J1IYI5_9DIPT|nr:CLUMA_CG017295, isoform A [Clunio marinus]